jgi:hypothetical protein
MQVSRQNRFYLYGSTSGCAGNDCAYNYVLGGEMRGPMP